MLLMLSLPHLRGKLMLGPVAVDAGAQQRPRTGDSRVGAIDIGC